jgi:hypothetical protein
MHGLHPFSNDLEFEIPFHAPARQLAARLSLAWKTWTDELDDSTLIVVELDSMPKSFARAMRIVQEWVSDEGLGAIRFCVDGRSYVLDVGEVNWRIGAPVA